MYIILPCNGILVTMLHTWDSEKKDIIRLLLHLVKLLAELQFADHPRFDNLLTSHGRLARALVLAAMSLALSS